MWNPFRDRESGGTSSHFKIYGRKLSMKKVMLVEDEELILQGIRNIVDWEELGLKVVHRDGF